MKKLIFSTDNKVTTKKRRYIGQKTKKTTNFFNSLSTWEKICFEVQLLNL